MREGSLSSEVKFKWAFLASVVGFNVAAREERSQTKATEGLPAALLVLQRVAIKPTAGLCQ